MILTSRALDPPQLVFFVQPHRDQAVRADRREIGDMDALDFAFARAEDKVAALEVLYMCYRSDRFLWLQRHDTVDECAFAVAICFRQLEGAFSINLAPVREENQMFERIPARQMSDTISFT